MVYKISCAFALIFAMFISSCIYVGPSLKGNGNVVEEKRTVDQFQDIKASRGVNVYISQGDEQKVLVNADENILEVITTKVENGVLKISTSERIRNAKSKKVYVTVVKVDKIEASAGSNIYSETKINNSNLELTCTAGSNMKLEINTQRLTASASAGANVYLNGTANKGDLSASAGSNIKARDLSVGDCKAKASSGSNVWVHVTDSFSGKASSGANVYYSGKANVINVSSSSGGNVRKMD